MTSVQKVLIIVVVDVGAVDDVVVDVVVVVEVYTLPSHSATSCPRGPDSPAQARLELE